MGDGWEQQQRGGAVKSIRYRVNGAIRSIRGWGWEIVKFCHVFSRQPAAGSKIDG